jgi:ABC-2 type transport system permease protein
MLKNSALIILTLAFFGLAWSGLSWAVAMKTRSQETLIAMTQFLGLPLLFMSTAMLPATLMPSWLQTVSQFNPLNYIVDAVRPLMISGFSWTPILQAYGVTAIIATITLALTLYLFRKVVS